MLQSRQPTLTQRSRVSLPTVCSALLRRVRDDTDDRPEADSLATSSLLFNCTRNIFGIFARNIILAVPKINRTDTKFSMGGKKQNTFLKFEPLGCAS